MLDGWHYCGGCFYDGNCERQKKTIGIKACKSGTPHEKFTNADKIRNMDNKELAEFISSIDTNECSIGIAIRDTVFLETMDDIEEWLEKECD